MHGFVRGRSILTNAGLHMGTMDDVRVPFDEAKRLFQAFLRSQGWPTDLLWLSRDRVVGRRGTHWVFRPEELTSEDASREFYEAARSTDSSIRLDAVAQLGSRSIALVRDVGGPSRMLNCGHLLDTWDLRPVSSRVAWACLRAVSRLWGGTPFLRTARFTGTAASVDELGAAEADFYERDVRRWLR